MDGDVRHVHHLLPVDDGRLWVGAEDLGAAVQLLHHRHKPGGQPLKIAKRPLFQRLGQDGVVGVGAGAGDSADGCIQIEPLLHQQADQLRNHQGGVGVVELHHCRPVELLRRKAPAFHIADNQLGRRAGQKILLRKAQPPALLIAVVRVEKEGQVAAQVGLVKVDAVVHQTFVAGLQIEQAQPGRRFGLIAGDIQLIEPRGDLRLPQRDGEGLVGAAQPVRFVVPAVGVFVLAVLLKLLPEQPKVVGQSQPLPVQAQRRNRIEEAGRQPPQTAVAQRGLRLQLLQFGQRVSVPGQQLLRLAVQSQVEQVVAQQPPDQKLRRDVVEPAPALLLIRFLFLLLYGFEHQILQRAVELPVAAGVQIGVKLLL